jgi:uncharacterized protein (DUF2235 family)
MSPKRLVLCLDGTWNNAYMERKRDDGHAVLKPSNVLKMARAVVPRDGMWSQVVYYDIGVGSLAKFPGLSNKLLVAADKNLGGGWGAGLEGNIEDALTFLVHNHEPGDEVFIFGFSRGAATAQAVTRFLDWAGGLPVKGDAYYLPQLFREYVVSRGADSLDTVLARLKPSRALTFQSIDVALLGVWDTVMALGSRFRARGDHTSTTSRSFHVGDRPAECVYNARQALAIDEVRYDFRPEIWSRTAGGAQTLEQRWFAGVHSNIGGGYVNDGLANLAFQWMIRQATALGLVTDPVFAQHYRGYAMDRLYRSETLSYRVLDRIRRRAGRGERSLTDHPTSAHLILDPSVIWRIQADPKATKPTDPTALLHTSLRDRYRPDNVLRHLVCQQPLAQYLTSIGVNNTTLPGDVVKRLRELA